jgi:hypothetical protein
MISRIPRSWNAPAAAILALLAGCSSSTDSTGSQSGADFIRFQASGAQIQFQDQPTSPVAATIAAIGSESSLNVTGQSAFSASPFSNIQITVIDPSPITTKTYGAFQPVGTSGAFTSAIISYNVGSVGYDNTAAGTGSDVQVTITEITSTTVRGTFSATVKTKAGAVVAISGGSFLAKRI